MELNFSIDVIVDAEVGVLVGTSEDIPGLTIEENSIHKFLETAMDLVPCLLATNLNITDNEGGDVNVHIELKELPGTKPKLKQVNPVYSLHAETDCTYAMA